MLKNYLSILIRGFRRSPVYSSLNIVGLAMGIACATFILLWIEDEFSFDRGFAKRDHLYSVRMNLDYTGSIESSFVVPWRMAGAIHTGIPEIINITRLWWGHDLFALTENGKTQSHAVVKTTYEDGLYVDSSYFSMLQAEFVKGNAANFNNQHTLVITERMAKKFFGTEDPVGKSFRVGNAQDYTIIGVVKDPPTNSSLVYSWLMPIQNFRDKNRWLDPWSAYGICTILELRPNADIAGLEKQLTAILRPHAQVYAKANCILFSMADWHLRSRFTNGKPDGGRITIVHIISAIGWIILLIACINFMNLATARAGHRAREVGVRKTLGSLRKSLIWQFLLESSLMSFAAVILAVNLVYLFLPAFNNLVDKQLTFAPLNPVHLTALISIGIFCGLIAGSYPAFYLSSFDPVTVMKGQLIGPGMASGAGFIRKTLVVMQFTFSVGLIVCTVIIYRQLQYVRLRDLGYNKEHLVYLPIQGDLPGHFDAIKADLMNTGVVENAALSSSPPLEVWSTTNSQQFTWPGATPGAKVKISWGWVTPDYFSTMGMQIKKGHSFYPDIRSDSADIIINENLAGIMGKAAHIGGYVSVDHQWLRIVGIVQDYLFNDMRGAVSPLILTCERDVKGVYSYMEIRLKPGNNLPANLTKMEEVIKSHNPAYPVDYHFVDQNYEEQFTIEAKVGQFAGIFSSMAVLISCLGLFGLAAYSTERRTKEIGIRKVLGASTAGLARLLSKEFLQLVTLSCVIAFPLAWWFMDYWLKNYSYRTAIHWWIFALAGAAAFMIALLTVSFVAIKAASANPVISLRTE